MEDLIEIKMNNLKRLGFLGNLDEIEKMYCGEWFDPQDKNVLKLKKITKGICNVFN